MSAQPIPFPTTRRDERKLALVREQEQQLNAKRAIDRAADVLDRLDERVSQIDRQIKRLQASKKLAQARSERIEERVLAEMSRRRTTTFEGLRRAFATRSNPARLIIEDEGAIAPSFLRVKTVSEPDKIAIKAALEAGEDVAGVRLVQGVSLRRSEV